MTQNGLAPFFPQLIAPHEALTPVPTVPKKPRQTPPFTSHIIPIAPHPALCPLHSHHEPIDQVSLLFCRFFILSSRLSLNTVAGVQGWAAAARSSSHCEGLTIPSGR